jgi:DNA invertase Pin-like site-specific DNA recombinase
VIAKLRDGDRVIVTDSSRLDRRDNLTSQVETMLAIRKTGAAIVSLAPGEETFANGDDLGSWVTTLVKQNANADKSRTVRTQTYRGISMIRDNNAHHGPLPSFWETQGERYAKQAYCTDPEAVRDIYERVANSESLGSIGRSYDPYGAELRKIQARLSATEDDDDLDALVAERKEVKARIEGFGIIPDSFDYAPTGQTVSQMWNDGTAPSSAGWSARLKSPGE